VRGETPIYLKLPVVPVMSHLPLSIASRGALLLEQYSNEAGIVLATFTCLILASLYLKKQLSRENGDEWHNWEGRFRCVPNSRHMPETEEEVVAIVRKVGEEGGKIKVVGGSHSWSDIALCTPADKTWHLLSLDRLDKLVEVDKENLTVTLQSGIRLYQVHEALDKHGLALINLGSISEQSVAGAFSTGTHGTGIAYGCLATFIKEIKMVNGRGELLHLTPDRQPELFKAAQVSLGALGVIVEYKISVTRSFKLQERVMPVVISEFFENLPATLSENDHVKVWPLPHTPKGRLWLQKRITDTKSVGDTNAVVAKLKRDWIVMYLFEPIVNVVAHFPALVPTFSRMLGPLFWKENTFVARSDKLFNCGYIPPHAEIEFSVPLERSGYYTTSLLDLLDKKYPTTIAAEVRFVAKDDIWMSPAYGRDSSFITVCIHKYSHARFQAISADVHTLFSDPECRPHWGKFHQLKDTELRQRYEHFSDFLSVREKMDPNRIFINDSLSRCLGVPV